MPFLVLQQAILDDGTGTIHPDAVYLPTNVVMDLIDGVGSVTWLPYHNANSLLTGEKGLAQCQVTQQLNKVNFASDSDFTVSAGAFGMAVSQSLIYVAKLVLDTPIKNTDGTLQLDPITNQPVLQSFFKEATVTTIG